MFIPTFEGPRPFKSVGEVIAAYPGLMFKTHPDPQTGGFTAFAVIGGDRSTGEIIVRAVIVNTTAKLHRHKPAPGAPYRELVCTIAGTLFDEDDEGNPVELGPGSVLVHNTDRPHAPRAEFWVGDYHQPGGSELVE